MHIVFVIAVIWFLSQAQILLVVVGVNYQSTRTCWYYDVSCCPFHDCLHLYFLFWYCPFHERLVISIQPADWDDREYINDANDVKPEVKVSAPHYMTYFYIQCDTYSELLKYCRDMIQYHLRFQIQRSKRSVAQWK